MDRVLRRLTRSGFRRALAGEHRAWFVVALAALVVRRARRPEPAAATVHLRPGIRYLVQLVPPPARGRAARGRAAANGGGTNAVVEEVGGTQSAAPGTR